MDNTPSVEAINEMVQDAGMLPGCLTDPRAVTDGSAQQLSNQPLGVSATVVNTLGPVSRLCRSGHLQVLPAKVFSLRCCRADYHQEGLMKQRTFEFFRRQKQKPIIEFPSDVTEKLVNHMAAAIIEVNRTRGEKNHDRLKTEQ